MPLQRDLCNVEDLKGGLTLPGAAEVGSTTKTPHTSLPWEEEAPLLVTHTGETAALPSRRDGSYSRRKPLKTHTAATTQTSSVIPG